MGLSSSKPSAEEIYKQQLTQLQAEAAKQNATIDKSAAAIVQVEKEQKAREEAIRNKKAEEIKQTLLRVEELINARKTLNIQSAVLLCAIMYNYPFGTVMDNEGNSWMRNANDIVKIAVNNNTFWLLCKIPKLLPLLWPTGKAEDNFHTYNISMSNNGEYNSSDYMIDINGSLKQYVDTTLKTYIINVIQTNTMKLTSDIEDKCAEFIKNSENYTDDREWLKNANSLISDIDIMTFKGLVARSGKGICKNKISLLPATYPKIDKTYEIYEAMIMLSNIIINSYGMCTQENGLPVPAKRVKVGEVKVNKYYSELTEEQKKSLTGEYKIDSVVEVTEEVYDNETVTPSISGGKCFKQPSNKSFETSSDEWDCKTFIPVKNIIIDSFTADSMLNPSISEDLEVYYDNVHDKTLRINAHVRYVNPTKKYTDIYFNSYDEMLIPFKMPRLSADINGTFKSTFIKNAFNALLENKEFNVYDTNNSLIMTSFDFMTMIPPQLEEFVIEHNVFPLARFMYKILIEYSCKWELIIPLNNIMSCSIINSQLMTKYKNKKYLPQYLSTKQDSEALEDGSPSYMSPVEQYTIDDLSLSIYDVETGDLTNK